MGGVGREREAREGVGRAMPGWELMGLEPMAGGMSAEMFLADLAGPGGERRRVVVRFPSAYVRTLIADPAAYEARAIGIARAGGVSAPEVLGLGEAEDGRFLVLEYLEGAPTAAPADPDGFVAEAAAMLAAIHSVPVPDGALMATKALQTPTDGPLNEDLREPEVVAALARLSPPSLEPAVFRHGDFWPGNWLWQGERLTGVIDWENALTGPALADLAISRLDVRWILGREAMEAFTRRYLELRPMPLDDLVTWDLRAARRPMANLPEWAGPYAALGRPDVTFESLRSTLLESVDEALGRS